MEQENIYIIDIKHFKNEIEAFNKIMYCAQLIRIAVMMYKSRKEI